MNRSPRGRASSGTSPQVAVHLGVAALCWLPLLLTSPGRVAADTRVDLHLDPADFLTRARSLWDPTVHMGTVTHQNLGLLFPMGAWHRVVDLFGLPVWVGQRLWLGAILFGAATGVLHLGRTLGWGLAGTTASACVYALSPYTLQYGTRTSALLLPFAGLPWMVSIAIRATRSSSWRHAAGFALVVGVVGTVNATSLVLVGIGPIVWLGYAAATRQVSFRSAAATAGRIGVLVLGVSAWWMVGLWMQARHGLPVLTYTETIDQVATTSAAPEVVRGLGYWVFYGREVLDPNVGAAVAYTQSPALLALTYLIPGAAVLAAVLVRFPHRGFFALLSIVGVVVAVGAHPVADGSLVGDAFRDAASTTAGLAMRSSTRAVPLVVLGLAVFLGRGVDAVARPALRVRAAGAVVLAALLALPALTTGGFVDPHFSRPEALPDHWREVARHLDEQPGDDPVLELPGIQFATYRWGTTYEPVSAPLLDKPVIAREQLPYGSAPSADLLIALDRRWQEGVTEPEALAPLARLMGAGWVLVRNDLAYERYVSVRPERLWSDLQPLPTGLAPAGSFGEGVVNEPDPRLPMVDEEALSLPPDQAPPSAVELLRVEEPLGRVRTEPIAAATILAGDGDGIVDLAAAGSLRPAAPLLYATTLLDHPRVLDEALDAGAEVVVTDTARRRQRRWRAVRWSTGHTQRADEPLVGSEAGDGELEIFPASPPSSQTTVDQIGGVVDASGYGGPFTLDPDVRPALAFDGRPDTSWVVGPISDPKGAWLELRADTPVTTDHLVVMQHGGVTAGNRITEVSISIDGEPPVGVPLDEASLGQSGQRVDLGAPRPISSVRVEILATATAPTAGGAPVGIAELRVGELQVTEEVVLPRALLDRLGRRLDGSPLTYVLTRLRSDPAEAVRADEERQLRRRFVVPGRRSFTIDGTVRLAADAPAGVTDGLLGRAGAHATASSVLPGSPANGPGAALDGDLGTAWRPAFRDLTGAWIDVSLDAPSRLDHLDLAIRADDRHSLPAQLEVSVDGNVQVVDVPPLDPSSAAGTVERVRLPIHEVTGSRLRVTVRAVAPATTIDYYTRAPIELPIGIAEISIPGATPVIAAPRVDTGCREDLVRIDGTAVPVRVTGDPGRALAGRALELHACTPLSLDGDVSVEAAPGATTGVDIDRLVLRDPGRPGAGGRANPPRPEVRATSPTRYEGTVGAGDEAWLVLAQSHNAGWRASLDGVDLGAPLLLDGGFNGWRLPPGGDGRTLTMEWEPQRNVDRAIFLSAAAALLCLALVLRPAARSHPGPEDPRPRRGRPSDRIAVGVPVVVASVFGFAVVGPAGAAVGAAAGSLAALHARGRVLVGCAATAVWLMTAGWIVADQVRDPRRPDFEWIEGLRGPHWWAMTALVMLVAMATAEALHRDDAVAPATGTGGWWRRRRPRPLGSGPGARPMGAAPDRSSRNRFLVAQGIAATAATAFFLWLVTTGRFELLAWQRVGDFYDMQAEAWLDGRWDMPPETLGIERFESRGRSFMYQGPWPAVLRVPFALVSDRFEGRLTQSSMTLGFLVAVIATGCLYWRVRRLLRRDHPIGWPEAAAAGILTFAVSAGSALGYAASRAWVYHEAVVWGVAWSLVALVALVGIVEHPSRRRFAMASIATGLALWSRSSVALGPLAGLAILAVANAIVRLRAALADRSAPMVLQRALGIFSGLATPARHGRVPVLAPIVSTVVPLVAYAAVNWVKFRTFFSIPFATQGFTLVDPSRRAMLAENGGSLFGLQFAPTTLLQYLRPDALDITTRFPFVDFPPPADPIGEVTFDLIDQSTSIPVSMAMLCGLTVVAAVAAIRARGVGTPGPGAVALRVPLLAGLAGALTIIPFGYVANRYLADAVPFLAVGAVGGLVVICARLSERPGCRGSFRWGLLFGPMVVLVVFATWVNTSLAVTYQRLYSPNVKDDVIAAHLDLTYDASQALGADPDIPLLQGDRLPETAPRGTLFAWGDCDALYLSDGMDVNAVKVSPWNAVERTERGGRYRRRITFAERPPGTREPLLSVTSSDGDGILFAEWRGGSGIAFGYEGPGVNELHMSPTRHVPPGRSFALDLVADPRVKSMMVWLDERIMLETYYAPTDGEAVFGRNVTGRGDVDTTFTGEVIALPARTGVCQELAAEDGA